MKQSTKVAGGVAGIGAALAMVLSIFSLDARYMKDAIADEEHLKEATSREAASVDVNIKVLILEIQVLSTIVAPTPVERVRLDNAKLQLAAYLERQGELAKPK